MSQLTTLSRPYAKAAFETALASGDLAAWSRMLGTLSAVVAHEKVANYLRSPFAGPEQQARTLIELCGEELNEAGRNFVTILAENKRLPLLPEIHRLFQEEKARQERTIDVEVVSAYALTDSVEAKLADSLKRRLQRDVKIHSRVDNSLLGGMVVRAGDLVIDGSVRGRLQKLAEAMKS